MIFLLHYCYLLLSCLLLFCLFILHFFFVDQLCCNQWNSEYYKVLEIFCFEKDISCFLNIMWIFFHCSIVLFSTLNDRHNLKDQFHINKRLQFWCKLFIVLFFFLLSWTNERNTSRPQNQILVSPHHFLVIYRITAMCIFSLISILK